MIAMVKYRWHKKNILDVPIECVNCMNQGSLSILVIGNRSPLRGLLIGSKHYNSYSEAKLIEYSCNRSTLKVCLQAKNTTIYIPRWDWFTHSLSIGSKFLKVLFSLSIGIWNWTIFNSKQIRLDCSLLKNATNYAKNKYTPKRQLIAISWQLWLLAHFTAASKLKFWF